MIKSKVLHLLFSLCVCTLVVGKAHAQINCASIGVTIAASGTSLCGGGGCVQCGGNTCCKDILFSNGTVANNIHSIQITNLNGSAFELCASYHYPGPIHCGPTGADGCSGNWPASSPGYLVCAGNASYTMTANTNSCDIFPGQEYQVTLCGPPGNYSVKFTDATGNTCVKTITLTCP